MDASLSMSVLGEPVVYPGHPVALAVLIMAKYPSLEAAETGSHCAALSDQDIPGAGGNVWMALDLLRMCRQVPVSEALELIERRWNNQTEADRPEVVVLQGQRCLAAFVEKAPEWVLQT
jgi:hypothetical protein